MTRSPAGINCEKNFAHSVFPAPGSPQKTKFIFAATQLVSNSNTGTATYSSSTIFFTCIRSIGIDLRMQMLLPDMATDSCTILIRSVSVSASNKLFFLLKGLLTSLAIRWENCSTNFSVMPCLRIR